MTRSRLTILALIAILLLATVLRVGWPGISEFKLDEAATLGRAMALAREGVWPRGTVSSVAGLPQPALKAVVLALPLLIAPDPRLAVIFLGLLGTAAVGLTFAFGRRVFGAGTGLIAAALLAASPWAVFFDRKLWAQNLTLMTLALMLSLFALIVERRWRASAGVLAALAALAGLYAGNLMFVGVLALALLLHLPALRAALQAEMPRSRLLWAGVAAAAAGAVLAAVILPDLPRYRAFDPAALTAPGGDSQAAARPLEHFLVAAGAAGSYGFHALAGDRWEQYVAGLPLPGLYGPFSGVLTGLLLAGMGYVGVRAVIDVFGRSRAPDPRYSLLAVWALAPPLIWLAAGMEPHLHRYAPLYPAQHLALAVLLTDGSGWITGLLAGRFDPQRLQRGLAAGLAVLVALAAIWQTVLYGAMLHFVSTGTPISGGHGPPARERWDAARAARRLAGPENLPVVVYTTGDNPETDGGAAAFDALLGDLELILVGGEALAVIPARPYVRVQDAASGPVSVERLPAGEPPEGPGIARLANGLDLVALVHEEGAQPVPGEPFPVTLIWQVWNWPPSSERYSYTIRLQDGSGQTRGQVDGPFLRSIYWQIGDLVTTTARIPVPADAPPGGDYAVSAGMYIYVSAQEQRGVDLLDVAGNPAGQIAIIPLKPPGR